MYCIRKFADCWAVFDLDTAESRALTAQEQDKVLRTIPSLADPLAVAWYGDELEGIDFKNMGHEKEV